MHFSNPISVSFDVFAIPSEVSYTLPNTVIFASTSKYDKSRKVKFVNCASTLLRLQEL